MNYSKRFAISTSPSRLRIETDRKSRPLLCSNIGKRLRISPERWRRKSFRVAKTWRKSNRKLPIWSVDTKKRLTAGWTNIETLSIRSKMISSKNARPTSTGMKS